MKTLGYIARLSFLLIFASCCCPAVDTDPAQVAKPDNEGQAFPLRVGVGQTMYDIPVKQVEKDGKVQDKKIHAGAEQAEEMLKEAVAKALADYGEGSPKLLWVFDRTNQPTALKETMDKIIPEGVDYIIDGSWWQDYSPIGPAGFSTKNQQSILAIALGGDTDIQTAIQGIGPNEHPDWELEKKHGKEKAAQIRESERKKHAEFGRELARKFDFSKPGQQVFFQMGTQHVPRHIYVLEGVKEIIGGKAVIYGGAQADWAWQIHNGSKVSNAVYGILISGNFSVSQDFAKRNASDRPTLLKQTLQKAADRLPTEPEVIIYMGCAGWNNQNEAQAEVVNGMFPDATFFGRFNGGEIGCNENGVIGDSDIASILMIGPAVE